MNQTETQHNLNKLHELLKQAHNVMFNICEEHDVDTQIAKDVGWGSKKTRKARGMARILYRISEARAGTINLQVKLNELQEDFRKALGKVK